MNIRALRWLAATLCWCGLVAGLGAAEPVKSRERVVLHTAAGDVVMAFYGGLAPKHMAQILTLVRIGAYDTVRLARVDASGYYVQVGDVSEREVPLTPVQQFANRALPAEFSPQRHVRGAISMARHPADPNSARSSLVFVLKDSPHLDPPNANYTIVGEVEQGLDVLDSLRRYAGGKDNAPVVPLLVLKAAVVGPDELARMKLRGPRLVVGTGGPAEGRSALPELTPELQRFVAGVGFSLMAVLSVATFGTAWRARAGRWPTSLALLGVLTCAFFLLILFVPEAWRRMWLGGALVVTGLVAIKLMTFFDAEK